jgi:hypothetical protein
MRIPNPRLVRLAGLSRGAIVEPGDGELEIPAVLQPLVEIPSPTAKVLGSGLTYADSFITGFNTSATGAQAGATTPIAIFTKGLWRITWTIDAMFTGTSSAVNNSGINIVDPTASVTPLRRLTHITGHQIADQGDFVILMQDDGWRLDHVFGVTIAGDFLTNDVCLMSARMM